LTSALGRLFALAEDYPDLKANETLGELQSQLEATETAIAGARQRYNNAVMQLNTMVESFPSNLVAGPFNFAKAVFFEIPEADRKPVRVDLR
jgi:LemA protein